MPTALAVLAILGIVLGVGAWMRLAAQPDHPIHRPPAELVRLLLHRPHHRHRWVRVLVCRCGAVHSIRRL